MAARLSTIGRLVKTILPQVQTVAIFDRHGELAWANDAEDHQPLQLLAADLLAGAEPNGPSNTMRCVRDAAASYAFVMRQPAGILAGALTLTIAGPFRRAGLLLPAALETRLAPLLAAAAVTESDSIDRVISGLATRIKADTIIVSVPALKLEHRFSQPASQLADLEALREVVRGDLAARRADDDQPVRDSRAAPAAPAFSYLCVPLRRRGALLGVIAAFAPHTRRPFSAQDTEFVRSSASSLLRLLN